MLEVFDDGGKNYATFGTDRDDTCWSSGYAFLKLEVIVKKKRLQSAGQQVWDCNMSREGFPCKRTVDHPKSLRTSSTVARIPAGHPGHKEREKPFRFPFYVVNWPTWKAFVQHKVHNWPGDKANLSLIKHPAVHLVTGPLKSWSDRGCLMQLPVLTLPDKTASCVNIIHPQPGYCYLNKPLGTLFLTCVRNTKDGSFYARRYNLFNVFDLTATTNTGAYIIHRIVPWG